jgi:hypothetical protein
VAWGVSGINSDFYLLCAGSATLPALLYPFFIKILDLGSRFFILILVTWIKILKVEDQSSSTGSVIDR